jgi:hypothetical protein
MRPEAELYQPQMPLKHHDVAGRAYELFLQRGGAHGHDWDDWFAAERELSRR